LSYAPRETFSFGNATRGESRARRNAAPNGSSAAAIQFPPEESRTRRLMLLGETSTFTIRFGL
jgi:hypothetical protein